MLCIDLISDSDPAVPRFHHMRNQNQIGSVSSDSRPVGKPWAQAPCPSWTATGGPKGQNNLIPKKMKPELDRLGPVRFRFETREPAARFDFGFRSTVPVQFASSNQNGCRACVCQYFRHDLTRKKRSYCNLKSIRVTFKPDDGLVVN